jgi:hypothetical protein
MDQELKQYLDAKFAELHLKLIERPAHQVVDYRAATRAAILRATDPALEAQMESVLRGWEETLERRRPK